MPAETQSILDSFLEQAQANGSRTAAMVKRDGKYEEIPWSELADQAKKIARSLIALNLQAGERVGLIAQTRLEWALCDLGILGAAGVTVPIYPSNLPDEVQYVLDHSGSRLVFVEDEEQAQKCLDVRDRLSQIRQVVQLTGDVPMGASGWICSFEDFLARGENAANAEELDEQLETRRKSLNADSLLTIIYTSGTTGRPKGVVLTHGAMAFEANSVVEIDVIRSSDTQLLFLPLAHVFAKVLEIAWFRVGHIMAFAENMTTIKQNLGEVRPTVMAGVPRVFEKFHAAVVEKGGSATGLKKKLFSRALELSELNGKALSSGTSLGLRDSLQFGLLKKIIFSKIGAGIREIMGGRMRILISGGAPLSPSIGYFFQDADVEILEGYGLTETCAGTCVNRPGANQIGTVGPAVPGVEVKIADDGEVLIKGPTTLKEYWNDPDATRESLVDGWFHTGDIGELDPRTSALKITDRKKDIIVTAGGKNVAPQKIEGLLKTHKLVSQVVVHGDKRKFLSALITLDPERLPEFAKGLGIDGSYEQLCRDNRIETEVDKIVSEVNGKLATYESIKKFKVLDCDFSIETGELTPKLSVKRKVINSKYGHYFDAFYAEKY